MIHPRYETTKLAALEIKGAILEIVRNHGLTIGETANILIDELQTLTTEQIRRERHPKSRKKACEK